MMSSVLKMFSFEKSVEIFRKKVDNRSEAQRQRPGWTQTFESHWDAATGVKELVQGFVNGAQGDEWHVVFILSSKL